MYQLELDRYQAHLVVSALDTFARVHMGQVNVVAEVLSEGNYDHTQVEQVRRLCDEIKAALGFAPSASFGIFNEKVPQAGKASWDIVCVLRQTIAKAEKHNSFSVWLQDPMHCDLGTPLPKCKFIEDNNAANSSDRTDV